MKNSITVLLFGCLSLALPIQAQKPGAVRSIDVGFSAGRMGRGTASVSYLFDWHPGSTGKFSIGTGVRFTFFRGATLTYITAPAKLTSGSTSPLIFFKENIPENLDTLYVGSSRMIASNFLISLGYDFNSSWAFRFNIDALGATTGSARPATFVGNDNAGGAVGTIARPTGFNVLLVSDNDRGTLNSEMFVRYRSGENWFLRLGAQFIFTEYTTSTKLQQFPELNDRFRNKSLMAAIGVTYQFHK